MSILRKYARPRLERDTLEKKPLSVRIPAYLYDRWKEECERNGYTISEGIRLLLELDLGISSEEKERERPRKPIINNKFSVADYLEPDNLTVRCPICDKGISRPNISRHAKDVHRMTTQELLEGHGKAKS